MTNASYISPQIREMAVRVDTEQKAAWVELAKWQSQQKIVGDQIRRIAGSKRAWVKRERGGYTQGEWDMQFTEAWDIAAAKEYAADILLEWTSAWVKVTELEARIKELESVWEKYRWQRAYLVTNVGGHVHSSTACSTCYPTTLFDWRTEYSGASEREIVEAAGELACTVCYPSAPVDVLSRPSAFTATERAAADAAKAERAAAKAAREAEAKAKAPTVSGEPLVIGWQEREPSRFGDGWSKETFKTERSAISWAVDTLYWDIVAQYKYPARVAQIEIIIEAVAAKRGVEPSVVRAEIQKKAEKRARQ